MKININELESIPGGQKKISFNEIIDDLDNQNPVNGVVYAKITEYGVDIVGHVSTDLTLKCDRCLEFYDYHLEVDFEDKFVKKLLIPEGKKEVELTEETLAEEIIGNEIDLTNLIYQEVLLNIPYRKLCNCDCPGFKEMQDTIKEEPIDPRLQIFKDITDEINKK